MTATQKLSEETIANIRRLRANGLSYRKIAEVVNVGYGSVAKYAKNVVFLPKSMRKNPFELLEPEDNEKIFKGRIPDPQNYKKESSKDYWIEQHVKGEPFDAPLDKFSITELQELMEDPTGYKSHMTMREWAIHYLEGPGNFLKKPPHKWGEGQLEIFDLWEEHGKLMIKCHRDYGKTMAVDAILTREICENRENNYAICSLSKGEARRRVKHIGDMFLRNKKIIADYGFLPHQKIYKGTRQSWTKSEITVKREISQTDPTLMCLSSDAKGSTGPHFDGVVFDDVWDRTLDRNPENKEKWLQWFDGELEGTLEDAWELWIYTRKSPTDLYQHFEDKQYYVIVEKPAVLKYPSKWHYEYKEVHGHKVFDKVVVESNDWEISDPSRFDIEFFLEKKLKMDPAEFESEYQLNPMTRIGKYWSWKDLRFIDGYTTFMNMVNGKRERRKMKILGSMDVALGTSTRADYTALAIIGYFEQKFYFLELYLKRGASESDMVKMFARARRTFPEMDTVYVEADFHQSSMVQRLKKKAGFINILPVLARQEQRLLEKATPERRHVNLMGKPLRIWSQLESLVENNRLYVNRRMLNFKEFATEFKTFPQCEHFDVLDALASGVWKMEKKGALIYALSG